MDPEPSSLNLQRVDDKGRKYYEFEFTATKGFTRHQLAVVTVADGDEGREGGVTRHKLAVRSHQKGCTRNGITVKGIYRSQGDFSQGGGFILKLLCTDLVAH